MLYAKDGRIHSEWFSYALPEGLFFYYDSGLEIRDGFQFASEDERLRLDVGIQAVTPLGTLEDLDECDEFVSMSDIFEVNRGGLKGKGLFYRSPSWRREYYEEHLELEPGLVLEICVICEVSVETRGKVRQVLLKSPVSDFLANIQAK